MSLPLGADSVELWLRVHGPRGEDVQWVQYEFGDAPIAIEFPDGALPSVGEARQLVVTAIAVDANGQETGRSRRTSAVLWSEDQGHASAEALPSPIVREVDGRHETETSVTGGE